MANTQRLSEQIIDYLQKISGPIRNKEPRSIVSGLDTIKSEFVNAILNPNIMKEYGGLPSDKYVFCLVDFQTLTKATPGEAYKVFLESVTKAIEDTMLPATRKEEQRVIKSKIQNVHNILKQNELTYIEFREKLEKFVQSGVALTFVFDNLDSVTKNSSLDANFFKSLRSLNVREIANFITVSSKNLNEFMPASGTGSDFVNLFMTERSHEYI